MRSWLAAFSVVALLFTGCSDDAAEFCDLTVDLEQQAEDEELELGTEEFQDRLDEIADEAPDEIEDDVDVIVEASEDFENADPDEVTEASENVEEFIEENCEED